MLLLWLLGLLLVQCDHPTTRLSRRWRRRFIPRSMVRGRIPMLAQQMPRVVVLLIG
jgi:hypothetical protein